MHEHEHEIEQSGELRPKGDRSASTELAAETDHLFRAAVQARRTDVLGRSGLLGLQRSVGNAAVGSVVADEEESSPVHDLLASGGGHPLDSETRVDMESKFGHDFSDVRVHTGEKADHSAQSVSAQAFTVGSNIVFGGGRYSPGSDSGRHMLAHELTHVVQQRQGPVDGTEAGGGVKISDPSDRFEQEAAATADAMVQRVSDEEVDDEEAPAE